MVVVRASNFREDIEIMGDRYEIDPVAVTLRGSVDGPIQDPFGNQRAAASFGAKIKRNEWGLNWNMALEAGGVVVSDEIRLEIDVTVLRKVPAETTA